MFSSTIPKDIAAHPVKHIFWGLGSAGCLVMLVLPILDIDVSHTMAHNAQARNDLAAITQALRAYYDNQGNIPKGTNAEILKPLRGNGGKDSIVFLNPSPKQINEAGELIDPWKTPYRLGMSADGFPWAYSCGPDKKDDGGAPGSDDIASW